VTRRVEWRQWREPVGLFVIALIGSAALWGRLWVTSPTTRGVCGCGDPSLFQWFLAWPAHAITTGHSLFFSRDLFHPAGINLLANTSVLGLGVPLAPVTWLGGPVLTENVALLLAVPVAVVGMYLFLRRMSTSRPARVVLALFYGFSPYVISSLSETHLMSAWIGFLPLIALGVADATGTEPRRARRGKVLLVAALVMQFFVSTELLLLVAIVAAIVLGILAIGWALAREVPSRALGMARQLATPLLTAGVLLVVPAAFALYGPRSLTGSVWGAGFNRSAWGTSLIDLAVPRAVGGKLILLSGYDGKPVVDIQALGWGLLAVAVIAAIWQWRDVVSRTAALTALCCCALAVSPTYVAWAPWRWLGRLPVLQNVVQLRIIVFALLALLVLVARAVARLEHLGPRGLLAAAAVLAIVVVPVAIPEAMSLPLKTEHVAIPTWWQHPRGHGVVLSYPFADRIFQGPLTWQAHDGFDVSLLGGSGPQAIAARAGADAAATALLSDLSLRVAGRPTASAANASLVRAMIGRDAVSEVVVPVSIIGSPLVTGAPSIGAAAFFMESLGLEPVVTHGAWVFDVSRGLSSPRIVTPTRLASCTAPGTTPPASVLWSCLMGATS